MHEAWMQQLEAWHDFYLLVGTAGVTLTGLLFVVVSLGPHVVADRRAAGLRAFVSPNAVFFATTFVVAVVLLAPDLPEPVFGAMLCCGSLASLGYLAYTKAHAHWRAHHLPLLDWIWYIGLPGTSYLLLLVSSVGFLRQAGISMYGVATSLILLLVTGIRNAWDLVIWVSQQEHE